MTPVVAREMKPARENVRITTTASSAAHPSRRRRQSRACWASASATVSGRNQVENQGEVVGFEESGAS